MVLRRVDKKKKVVDLTVDELMELIEDVKKWEKDKIDQFDIDEQINKRGGIDE